MSAKKKAKQVPKVNATQSDPLIKTLAQVDVMTAKEKEAFRLKGGTTINNPI